MCADSTQVDYEQLDQIARRLDQESDAIADHERQLRQAVEMLCAQHWSGQAADSFRREMLGRSLPALQRCAAALAEASHTAGQIQRIYHEHEEEAAGLFRGQEAAQAGPGAGGGARGQPAASGGKWDARLDVWEYDVLKNKSGLDLELDIKYGVVDTAYIRRKGDDGMDVFGHSRGLVFGMEKKGLNLGPYAEGYIARGDVDGVLGNDRLGLTGGVGVTAVSAEGFLGWRHTSFGGSVGVKLAAVDGKVGVNVAGWNVNLIGEAGLKAEFGFTIGAETQVKLPFLSLGFSFGRAEAN